MCPARAIGPPNPTVPSQRKYPTKWVSETRVVSDAVSDAGSGTGSDGGLRISELDSEFTLLSLYCPVPHEVPSRVSPHRHLPKSAWRTSGSPSLSNGYSTV